MERDEMVMRTSTWQDVFKNLMLDTFSIDANRIDVASPHDWLIETPEGEWV